MQLLMFQNACVNEYAYKFQTLNRLQVTIFCKTVKEINKLPLAFTDMLS